MVVQFVGIQVDSRYRRAGKVLFYKTGVNTGGLSCIVPGRFSRNGQVVDPDVRDGL